MSLSNSTKVRVRIAPSPTGFAHIGTLWMAIFNYAFAKRKNGSFILRLDDTDIEREVKGAETAIYKGLSWAGLSWDEGADKGGKYGPYRQSEKLEKYRSEAEKLVSKDLAYVDGKAVRVRGSQKRISWKDLIRGEVSFPAKELSKDFVVIKSNGYPTYHFATVIDEIDMKITHVIRGDEHISNTPRQLYFYDLLGAKPPLFAHIPTIRNKSGKKLSKRRDTVDISLYMEKGYLPEALVNYLCLIGWSHPEGKEIFDLKEFTNLFSLDRVQKSEPKFDTDKLDWINGEYIRRLKREDFIDKLQAINSGLETVDRELLAKIALLIKTRIKTFSDFDEIAGFFFKRPKVAIQLLGDNYKSHLSQAIDVLENLESWDIESINDGLMKLIKEKEYKTGQFFMDLRIAITGKKFTPPINESIEILGKEETISRLESIVEK